MDGMKRNDYNTHKYKVLALNILFILRLSQFGRRDQSPQSISFNIDALLKRRRNISFRSIRFPLIISQNSAFCLQYSFVFLCESDI